MRRIWELLALLIIGGMLVQTAIAIIQPLVPYMLVAGLLVIGGGVAYRRNRSW